MRVDEVVLKYRSKKRETIAERVFKYLQENPEQVFRYDSKDLQDSFPEDKIESLNYSLWSLEKSGRISKFKISPKVVYFGSFEAINSLAAKLKSSTNE